MNVIDLRDELYKRRIIIIEISDNCVYYAEELKIGDEGRIYIYCYDFEQDEERVLSYFTLDDPDYVKHFYPCRDSIIILFENYSSRAWLIKLDKTTGTELFRKKVSLIGRYHDCVPIDDNYLLIYTKADDDSRGLFNRCLETTNSDTIANMYDMEKGYRYFMKDFKTADLIRKGMHSFETSSGEEKFLLCDSYCGEAEKEELVKTMADQLRRSGEELRDNIWLISKKRLIDAIKSGIENIDLRRAASAGLEGTVRFECMCSDRIIFRAKVYKTGLEQFFEMSSSNGKVKAICTAREQNSESRYFTDTCVGCVYYLTEHDDMIHLEGEVGSGADITFSESAGEMISCIDERFIIADRSQNAPKTVIFDSKLDITDVFQARAAVKGRTVVLY